MPTSARGPACHLLEAHGLSIVLDLGSGSLRGLARLGVKVADLSAVGVTHRHQDHVADLLPLIFALRYVPELARRVPLDLFGYPGLFRDMERLVEVFGGWVLDPGFELRVHELPPGERLRLEMGAARAEVTAHAVAHTPEAVAFRIRLWHEQAEERSRVVSYSGDTGPAAGLVELARGADLFVCECAFPDDRAVSGHLTPSSLLDVCAAAAPRRVVATHLYPVWDERGVERIWEEALAGARTEFELIPARDGLSIDLGVEDAG